MRQQMMTLVKIVENLDKYSAVVVLIMGILWGIDYAKNNLVVSGKKKPSQVKTTQINPSIKRGEIADMIKVKFQEEQNICRRDIDSRLLVGETRFSQVDEKVEELSNKVDELKDNVHQMHLDLIEKLMNIKMRI